MTFKQLQGKISGRGYKQQKFGITYHFAWVLGLDWGIKGNFTNYLLRDHSKIKMFDAPYLLTMGAENGGWCRYQLLPASMHGHRVNFVYHYIPVNVNEDRTDYIYAKIWEGGFHCVDCKLGGNAKTMEAYNCFVSTKIDWMEECGCSQCKRGGEPCTWAKVSMICHKS